MKTKNKGFGAANTENPDDTNKTDIKEDCNTEALPSQVVDTYTTIVTSTNTNAPVESVETIEPLEPLTYQHNGCKASVDHYDPFKDTSFNLGRLNHRDIGVLAIDAEWQALLKGAFLEGFTDLLLEIYHRRMSETGSFPLSAQFCWRYQGKREYIIYIDAEVFSMVSPSLSQWLTEKALEGLSVRICPVPNFLSYNLVEEVLKLLEVSKSVKVELLMFFSPKDLEYSFGSRYYGTLLTNKLLEQKRNIKVAAKTNKGAWLKLPDTGHEFLIKDLKGWQGVGGFKGLCKAVNVQMRAKEALDDDKRHMLRAFIEKTAITLEYSLGDVENLMDAYLKYQLDIEDISEKLLGLKVDFELPRTTGAMIAKIYEQWLFNQSSDRLALEFCLNKLGMINPDQKNVDLKRRQYHKAISVVKDRSDLYGQEFNDEEVRKGKKLPSLRSQFFKNIRFDYRGHSQASVKYFSQWGVHSDAFNALVQGGYIGNKRPDDYFLSYTLDIDQKSCYGSALAAFDYALGLPTIYGYTSEELKPTLGDFLKQYESELVAGLYTITVDTSEPLTFRQDLIFSKTTNHKQIKQAYIEGFKDGENDLDSDISSWGLKEDPANIPGDFVLARREIRNGIITAKVLKTLREVASDREWGELLQKLKVTTAAVYRKSDECSSIDEWCDTVIADKGKRGSRSGKVSEITDTRTRAWCRSPIKNFLSGLLTERGRIKKLKKTDKAYAARDTLLKLFINTLYGVLASPYFDIGNTVVANNITAKARVGVWMMDKGLHTRMLITDGGYYTPFKVPYLDKTSRYFTLPSLDVLSDDLNWSSTKDYRKRGQKFKSLGGDTWEEFSVGKMDHKEALELAAKADRLAENHLVEFWANYGLELEFEIEHKETNAAFKAAYWGKGHYAFDTVLGERIYKIRGARQYDDPDLKSNPMYEIFDSILDGEKVIPEDLGYNHTYLLKIGEYYRAQSSKNGYQHLNDLMPGDDVCTVRELKLRNNYFPYDTIAEFETAKRRKEYRMDKGVRISIPKYEQYRDKGLDYVVQKMLSDSQNAKGK